MDTPKIASINSWNGKDKDMFSSVFWTINLFVFQMRFTFISPIMEILPVPYKDMLRNPHSFTFWSASLKLWSQCNVQFPWVRLASIHTHTWQHGPHPSHNGWCMHILSTLVYTWWGRWRDLNEINDKLNAGTACPRSGFIFQLYASLDNRKTRKIKYKRWSGFGTWNVLYSIVKIFLGSHLQMASI